MRDRDERRPVAAGPWMWTVEAADGALAMGYARSRLSALRWVHDVMRHSDDAEAFIVGPGLWEPIRLFREDGIVVGNTGNW